jgi:hypothetical protein
LSALRLLALGLLEGDVSGVDQCLLFTPVAPRGATGLRPRDRAML